jgi:hypothetical protein
MTQPIQIMKRRGYIRKFQSYSKSNLKGISLIKEHQKMKQNFLNGIKQ